MIRNIVFDLGNVLISFRPSEFFDKLDYPGIIKNRILTDIFGSQEWHQLDKGEINIRQATESISLKSTLKRQEIAHIFNLRTEIMFPMDQNVRLLPELKKQGYRLYYLSNFPLDIFEEIKRGYFFFRYFDGGVISSEVKSTKPDPRIYRILIEKYTLDPGESLFIDDIESNVTEAQKVGFRGLFTYGSDEISGELYEALGHADS